MIKRYLITGASSDVGAALLERLLSRGGPDDLFAAQGWGDMQSLAGVVRKYPARVQTYETDLASEGARALFLQSLEGDLGVPTHIVHLPALRVVNAKFRQFDAARFAADMQVQVYSAAALCQKFLPQMAKQKYGRVLFMLTSYLLGTPPKNTAAYIMAKEALHGLAKSLAADFAPSGITVNCVAPSMMETKFLADTSHLIVQAAAEANPMGRNATVQDVVPAMDFLLSDEAGFITGAVLPITGGSA